MNIWHKGQRRQLQRRWKLLKYRLLQHLPSWRKLHYRLLELIIIWINYRLMRKIWRCQMLQALKGTKMQIRTLWKRRKTTLTRMTGVVVKPPRTPRQIWNGNPERHDIHTRLSYTSLCFFMKPKGLAVCPLTTGLNGGATRQWMIRETEEKIWQVGPSSEILTSSKSDIMPRTARWNKLRSISNVFVKWQVGLVWMNANTL